jgi:hypothetical protein
MRVDRIRNFDSCDAEVGCGEACAGATRIVHVEGLVAGENFRYDLARQQSLRAEASPVVAAKIR